MTRHFQRIAASTALVAALLTSGCADLPVVGPAFESIKPMLDPILSPIKGMLGMSEEVTPVVSPTPRARARRARAKANSPTANASGSVDAGQAEATEAHFARVVERNKEFDRLRTTGMMQLYGGETRMAIETFEKAAKIRPEDAHIRELIELAKNPPRTEQPGISGEGVPSIPGGFLQ
jgi:hypothetical protein